METTRICSGCRKPLASNAPQGLCPQCLLKGGLGSGVDIGPNTQSASGRSPFVAPPSEQVAKLFPQLEILGFIGQGGMGAVYRARQKELDRVVALKILPPDIGRDTTFAERFTREAKALAKLNHPGVVTLYEFGRADGLFFFLMEFVDGVNLRRLLEAGRLSSREALAIVPQICDALQYAHDQGIVHRDIKPENILLDRRGRVKVADFGLAKLVGTDASGIPLAPSISPGGEQGAPVLTEAGKVMGTPQYMAPEQREHPTEVDHRADIYSLGVVFYQMLTGELPGKPIEPPSHTVRVDVRLDEVVLRALQKNPERRYQQVSQVKTAVETIANSSGERSAATPAAPSKPPVAAAMPQFGNLVAGFFGLTFTSPRALKVANLSALGFIGCLGFIPIPSPRWQGVFGLFGFFGLIGVAFMIEAVARRKRNKPIDDNSGAAADAGPVGTSGHTPDEATMRNRRRLGIGGAVGAAGLLAVGVGLFVWVQRPQRLDAIVVAESPDGKSTALASTWRAMRVFGGDSFSYRFTIQGPGVGRGENWEVQVPVGALTDGNVIGALEHYFFAKHGRIQWSEDSTRASFLVRGIEVSALNLRNGSYSSQESFLPEHEVELAGNAALQGCFLDLDEGRVSSAPKEFVESLRGSGRLAGGSPQVEAIRGWMRTNGLDIVKRANEAGLLQVDGASAILAEWAGAHAQTRGFDAVSANQVIRAIQAAEQTDALQAGTGAPAAFRLGPPRTVFAFKSHEGLAGLLEVVEDDPRSGRTRLRYKLVDAALEKQPLAPGPTTFKPIPEDALRLVDGIQGMGISLFRARQENDLAASMKVRRDLDARKEALLVQLKSTGAEKALAEFLETIEALQRAYGEQRLRDARQLAAESTAKGGILERVVHKELRSRVPPPEGASERDAAFGPETERLVMVKTFLDLDTGEVLDAPAELADRLAAGTLTLGAAEVHNWMRFSGADLTCQSTEPPSLLQIAGAVGLAGMLRNPDNGKTIPKHIDQVTAQEVIHFARGIAPQAMKADPQGMWSHEPATANIFKTRDGGMGVLEITGYTESPPGVKIRYKLVQNMKVPASENTNHSAGIESATQAVVRQQVATRLAAIKSHLRLTDDQERAVRVLLERKFGWAGQLSASMSAGSLSNAEMQKAEREIQQIESQFKEVLDPEQWADYERYQTGERRTQAQLASNVEVMQLQPVLQLSQTQREQVHQILTRLHEQQLAKTYDGLKIPLDWEQQLADIKAALQPALTAEQIQGLDKWLDLQRETIKNTMPKLTRPTATANPATGGSLNAASSVPLIEMKDVPLAVAIKALAKQAGLSYLLDPKLDSSQFDSAGRPLLQSLVSLHSENISAQHAISSLLKNYNLEVIDDPQTGIARIKAKDVPK